VLALTLKKLSLANKLCFLFLESQTQLAILHKFLLDECHLRKLI